MRHPYAAALREIGRAILLGWMAAACTTVRPRPFTLDEAGAPRSYDTARITLKDGSRIDLRRVVVSADSVTGTHVNAGFQNRVAVPVDSVAALEQRQIAVGRTVLLVAGVGLAVFVAVVVTAIALMANEGT